MTLRQYQCSSGIDLANQIWLINNNNHFPPKCSISWKPGMNSFQIGFQAFLDRMGKKIETNPLNIFYGSSEKSVDDLSFLLRYVKSFRHRDEVKLLIGKGDYEINDSFMDQLPDNISTVLANNVNTSDDRVFYLPMGRDFRSVEYFDKIPPQVVKNNLVYANFSVNTHPIRLELANSLKSKDFIKFDHMGEFLNYTLSRDEFFRTVADSKFSICPRGNGLDTFRLWDSLYLGTVPIVVREATFHDQLQGLPILFLDDYKEYEYLEKLLLEDVYEEMLDTEFNYELLKLENWLRTWFT